MTGGVSSFEKLPPILPSDDFKSITDDVRFANLVPQKLLRTNMNKTGDIELFGYDDAYSGVIVTKWGFPLKGTEDYYDIHIDIEQWKYMIQIMENNEYDYKIISHLPKDKTSSNFLEDLARSFFGLDINY